MGNSRNFRPGRQARRQSLKDQIRAKERELSYMQGLTMSLQAQLAATKMERPADLENWINDVALADMSPEEREQWEALSEPERETFMDELGLKINTTMKLAAVGITADDGEAPRQPEDEQGS
jgi:hypothetical protein